jgi:hypothetical protein
MRQSERGGTRRGQKAKPCILFPFYRWGRTVPGPGEEYGAEDYVLLPDVFGDMGGKKSKPSPKPSLPLPKEVAAQKGEKPDTGPSVIVFCAPDSEAWGQGVSQKRDKEKRWARWRKMRPSSRGRRRVWPKKEKGGEQTGGRRKF